MALTLLYDGHCTLCVSEMRRAARLDRQQRLNFIDISDGDLAQRLREGGCDCAAALGLQRSALLWRLHAIDDDGQLLIGMDAIRALYAALGFAWLARPTGWPVLRPVFDRLYAAFADHRYVFGRCESGQCAVRETGVQP